MASPDFVKLVRELPESTLIVDFKVKPVVAEIAETDPLNIPKPTLLAVDETRLIQLLATTALPYKA